MSAGVRNTVLFSLRRLSAYIVTYPSQHKVMTHIDPVPLGRYFKFNVVLKQPKRGGVFHCQKCILNLFGRVYLFRPDKYEHGVTRIEQGERRLFSLAIIL